jgi:hypothetical protein
MTENVIPREMMELSTSGSKVSWTFQEKMARTNFRNSSRPWG